MITERDYQNILATAREQGHDAGFAEGREAGRAAGLAEGEARGIERGRACVRDAGISGSGVHRPDGGTAGGTEIEFRRTEKLRSDMFCEICHAAACMADFPE